MPETSSQVVALAEGFLLSQAEEKRQAKQMLGPSMRIDATFPEAEGASLDQRQSAQAQERGHDALSCEWALLDPGQRALYREVMLEVHGSVASLDQEGRSVGETLMETNNGLASEEKLERFSRGPQEHISFPSELAETEVEQRNEEVNELHQQIPDKNKNEDSKENIRNPSRVMRKKGGLTVGKRHGRNQSVHLPKQKIMKTSKSIQCGKYFRNRARLLVHQRIQKGQKYFQWSECGKRFSQRGHLQQHQRAHTGEKPFECSESGKRFTRSRSLQQL